MTAIHAFGSEDQKRRWLPRHGRRRGRRLLRAHRARGGQQPGRACTRPRAATASDWVLDGAKRWIGLGSIADVAVVWAQHRRRRARLPRRRRHARASPRATSRTSARCARRCSASCTSTAAGCPDDARLPDADGPARPVHVPERRALRHRLGRRRRRAQLLRGARSSTPASASSSAARSPASSSSQARARRDGRSRRQGHSCSPCTSGGRRTPGGCAVRAHQRRQARQRAHGREVARLTRAGARRRRHHERLPGHAPHGQPRGRRRPTRAPPTSTR